jgi:hypothetical protein
VNPCSSAAIVIFLCALCDLCGSNMDLSPITCTAEQLYRIVSGHNRSWLLLSLSNPAMTEDHLVALLRNPTITAEIIENIHDRFEWASSQKVQCAIINCPKTPFGLAMRLLPNLFWHDLLKTLLNYRISPRLRRVAENYLRDKIENMTLGEKISLARQAPRPVIPMLRAATEKQIVAALLQNPNIVEEDIFSILNNDSTPPEALEAIAISSRWSGRYSVQLALVQNTRTPLRIALRFLSRLRKQDLTALSKAPHTPELIRRAADRILSGKY